MPEKEQQFFGKTPERSLTAAEIEKFTGNLREFLKSSSLEMQKRGIPVNALGRVDMGQFGGVYSNSTLEADRQYVKEKKEIFRRAKISEIEVRGLLPGLKERAIQEERFGEIAEMLVAAILQKNLKDNSIILRSSEYDDIKNGVDALILDKNTGNIVCALDEISSVGGQRYQAKMDAVSARNSGKGGGSLEYGVFFKRNSKGETALKKGRLNNIPLFYCAFPKNQAVDALRGFQMSKESSPAEKELFNSFLESLRSQTASLLKKESLDQKLRERLELLEKYMLELK